MLAKVTLSKAIGVVVWVDLDEMASDYADPMPVDEIPDDEIVDRAQEMFSDWLLAKRSDGDQEHSLIFIEETHTDHVEVTRDE